MRISLAALGLLVGCVTQENFWPRYGEAHCDIIFTAPQIRPAPAGEN